MTTRNRMVVFRLTEDEYSSLRQACKSRGGRNLSEFTRSGLLDLLRPEPVTALMEKRLCGLEEQLSRLELAIARVSALLARGAVAENGASGVAA